MRILISLFTFLFLAFSVPAQQLNIIPQPSGVRTGAGGFSLTAATVIVVKNAVDDHSAAFLNSYLKRYYGLSLKKVKSAASNYIQLTTVQTLLPGKEGAYSLSVAPGQIVIQGQTASGTFYGMQTLIQLLPAEKQKTGRYAISAVDIQDEPRFAYRGMHLDVGRHFFPVSFIKKYIDYLALHKINTFHWHLTEDQGWRIEIKKYPKLTSVGGWRNGTIIGRYPGAGNDNKRYGGFYTQAEIKEVVRYASTRFIDVIPEIEMPGHSSAAIAAYPWLSCFPEKPTHIPANMISKKSVEEKKKGRIKLVQETWGVFDDVFCAGKDSTFTFLQDVIDEVITLFPSRYFHVGGDECPKTHWKICPKCQQRMKDLGLKDEHELQSYFIQRMEKYLNAKGKTLIGWDEILEGGLAPNAIVMSWRGEEGGIAAAKQHHNVIMTPGNPVYFDHTQSLNEDSVTIGGYNPIEKVYAYEPIPAELNAEEGKYVLGAQANVWTEYMKNTKKIEYMIFPRMAALSEVLWSKKENKSREEFEKKLQTQFRRYDLWKSNYSKACFAPSISIIPSDDYNGIVFIARGKKGKSSFYFGNKNKSSFSLFPDSVRSIIRESGLYGIRLLGKLNPSKKGEKWGNAYTSPFGYLFQQDIPVYFNKATGKQISLTAPPSGKYPGDGPFTLVNGIQNEKGLARSTEFLGWDGNDMEAVIDLGSSRSIGQVIVHTLSIPASWIYPPLYAEVYTSADGQSFSPAGRSDKFEITKGSNGIFKIPVLTVAARYIKIVARNFGVIPDGKPGAGNKAWLFVSEIEAN